VHVKAVVMPALGVAMSEGVLLRWLKAAGETVSAGEPIMEIETDKSTMDVESPAAGVVGALLFEPGAIVPVGVEMTHILEAGDVAGGGSAAIPAEASPAAEPETAAAPAGTSAAALPGLPGAGGGPDVRGPNRLSPRERRLAKEREEAAAAAADGADAPAETPIPRPATAAAPPVGSAAAGRHRDLIAAKVSESWRSIPHFAVTREVAAAGMAQVRARRSEAADRPSVTDLMLKALALALHDRGEPGPIDVGLAVATTHGVAIPVIRGVLALDFAALRGEREAAVARAREGRLRPADLTDPPRSTLSNLGTLGIDSFTGVIALGQMSLLTVGRILPRPWIADGVVTIRDTFIATLNVDHRYLDGEDAARLLLAFVSASEDADRLESEVVPT
jgi:pyruvate dehydrogenase E2 component (dihydrolipoamide acetyltransferase)